MPILKPIRGSHLNRSHPLAHGLVGCWLFNEATGKKLFDLSGNDNSGTFIDNPQWKSGRYGGGLEFDGSNDAISIGADSSLNFSTLSFSIVWLMKYPITQSFAFAGIIVDQKWSSGASNTNWWGIVQNSAYANSLKYYDEQTGDGSFDNNIVIDSNIPEGWHHFVFIRDAVNKRFKFYRDSIAVYNSSYTAQTNLISGGLYIAQAEANRYTGGEIEELKIYNCALSTAEVLQLYREPFCMFERVMNPSVLFVPIINLAGASTAHSATDANLKRMRKIKGFCSAAASAAATLGIVEEVLLVGSIGASSLASGTLTLSYRGPWLKSHLKIQRQWLTDALFVGITANAFKLGTTLTCGWFWVRSTGCTALYRGSNMEQMDFVNILAVVEQNVESVTLPSYVPQKNGSTWFYVIRRFSNCGWQEGTLQAAVKVAIDADGNLAELSPNSIFAWRAGQVAGNKVKLDWFYCSLEQKSKPLCFKIYYDSGTGQIDFENSIATIDYQGRMFYCWQSEELSQGRYLFAVRAEDAEGIENNSLARMAMDIIGDNLDEVEILKVETF